MAEFTRRDFLKYALAGLGAILAARFISACSSPQAAPSPPQTPPAPGTPTAEGTGPSAVKYPDLVVVRGGEPETLARKAIDLLGGIKRFVKKGDNVIIKPNIGPAMRTYEYAATTNPWLVAAVTSMCLEAGAGRVRVMDKPFSGTAESGFLNSGIREEVEKAGGEIELMSRFKYASTDIPLGRDIKKWDIYQDILKADVLINMPIAKHHSASRLTLGMKNLMGVVNMAQLFHLNLGQRIADLASRVRPTLTIIDAIRILTANGPTGGDLNDVRKLDTVIAGTDMVAVDSYATSLFKLRPDDIPYIKIATEMGLGSSDLNKLDIKEITLGS
ncbi:MAG: DUF362 domain-containing protein [Dehalococcoidia bacterium]|nr:DUF362 domain-containing protein [Dehalococcoidia bacterium]MDD5648391.1 DUF362 domain-containing protein [Dehalococcoidia bacterium]